MAEAVEVVRSKRQPDSFLDPLLPGPSPFLWRGRWGRPVGGGGSPPPGPGWWAGGRRGAGLGGGGGLPGGPLGGPPPPPAAPRGPLAGGNPQIAKADGDAPVQAYIAAMPGWKRDVGRRLDALIVRTVPDVRKAVKWNSPFYGVEGQGWFLNVHCFTKYVKVAFFRGTSLRPLPPGESKHKEVRPPLTPLVTPPTP